MKKPFFVLIFLCAFCIIRAQQTPVLPLPNDIIRSTGVFDYSKEMEVKIMRGDEGTKQVSKQLLAFLSAKKVNVISSSPNTVYLNLQKEKTLTTEAYELNITPHQITITGATNAGLFYGMQTLFQLMNADTSKQIACMQIKDAPAFAYRGMHLDVSRHFFGPDVIKQYLDVMGKLKLNYFHWHLTDDQGWRMESKKYPRLTEKGAWRTEKDGSRHGGYYTQEEIKEIVQYAKERFITIIPEIDIPGHSSAIIAAYPEFGCYPDSIQVPNTFGIKENILCPSDATFRFLADILEETTNLFPGRYFHIGGDEVPTKQWEQSERGKTYAAAHNLKPDAFHALFIERMQETLSSKNKDLIGWGEILETSPAKEITIMSWRNTKAGTEAAEKGHRVIMTPRTFCYFDYPQDWDDEKKGIYMTYLPLDKVYNFNPLDKIKSKEAQKKIWGGQACVWTEFIEDTETLQYQIFPRIVAMSESLWTNNSGKNYADFEKRLKSQKNYFVKEKELPPVDLIRFKPKK